MSESDRATLIHAAELLEREASITYVGHVGSGARDLHAHVDDLLATASALREMAG